MMKSGRTSLLKLMGAGAVLGLLISAVVTCVMPKIYESEAVITVDHYRFRRVVYSGFEVLGEPVGDTVWDEQASLQFFAAEFERLKSRESLAKVIESLSLTRRWNVDKVEAIRILREIIVIRNIRESDCISIRVRHSNKEDARNIAGAVVASCRDYWQPIAKKAEDAMIVELDQAIKDQEDKVEERKKALTKTMITHGVVYKGQVFLAGQIDDKEGNEKALQEYEPLKAKLLQLHTQIDGLLRDSSYQYAAGLDLPNNVVRDVFPKYQEAKQNLEALKSSGLGDTHPTILAAAKELGRLNGQLQMEAVNLRSALIAQMDNAGKRMRYLENFKDISRGRSMRPNYDMQDYVDAKRDFETDQELLQQLKTKKISADIGSRIPAEVVEIDEPPELADAPVSPNVTLNLILGTVAGFILFPIAGLLVMGVMRICGNPK